MKPSVDIVLRLVAGMVGYQQLKKLANGEHGSDLGNASLAQPIRH